MSYPPGHYPAGRPNDEYNTDISPGDDPSWETTAYLEMSRNWHPIDACIGGTDYLRINAAEYLPQEPMELEDAWKRRVSHATFSPFGDEGGGAGSGPNPQEADPTKEKRVRG